MLGDRQSAAPCHAGLRLRRHKAGRIGAGSQRRAARLRLRRRQRRRNVRREQAAGAVGRGHQRPLVEQVGRRRRGQSRTDSDEGERRQGRLREPASDRHDAHTHSESSALA
jgi:hypothetical protein